MDLSPGVVVAGRYRVERKVGTGGMGEVWLGEHVAVGVRVALKTLLAEPRSAHDVIARFKREAYLLGRVKSDHIARILDFVADETFGTVLVMEFVDGDVLAKVLQYKQLTVEETIDLGADVATALVDLHHAKIIHRDLKPGNVILQPLADGRKRAVIVDFGVSRMVSDSDSEGEEITGITTAGMTLGTLEYMAPEQLLSSRDAKETADIYALGAILWRALTGKHIFLDARDVELAQKKIRVDPSELALDRADKLAVGLRACVMRAVQRLPHDRYQRAEDMLADLLMLRDLARLTALDLDAATTQDAGQSAVLSEFAKTLSLGPSDAHPPVSVKPPIEAATTVPTTPPTSLSAASSSLVVPAPVVRRGVPASVFAAALMAALMGGAVGATLLRGVQSSTAARDTATPAASASVASDTTTAASASALAPPTTPSTVAPEATESPAASAATSAAAPVVTPGAPASAPPFNLDDLDPASRAALDGTLPIHRPPIHIGGGALAVKPPKPDAGADFVVPAVALDASVGISLDAATPSP